MSDRDDYLADYEDDRAEHFECLADEQADQLNDWLGRVRVPDQVIDLTEPTDLTDAQTDRLAEILTNEILRTNHEAANHVLWYTNRGGYAPGSFTASLLDCFDRADHDNHVRLATVYPEYGWAVEAARRSDWAALHQAAKP